MKNLLFTFVIFFSALLAGADQPVKLIDYRWTKFETQTEGDVTGRHENIVVEYKGKFYMLGGRTGPGC